MPGAPVAITGYRPGAGRSMLKFENAISNIDELPDDDDDES
jgi:hypothetical protein